nr:hypothetical protein [Tanacetum cinerariifolium]
MKQDGNKKDQSRHYGILQDVKQYKDLVKIRSKQSELKRSKELFNLHNCNHYMESTELKIQEMEEDGDDDKSEEDFIEYPTSRGDDDADDHGDDLLEDDADEEDEEESSDSEEEEEEHLVLTVPALALHSSIPAFEDSDETEPFMEGETAATPPPFGYSVAARISVQPHILTPFRSESKVERLLAIPTPPLSPVSPTSYPLPPFLMPLPIFNLLPTSSFPLPLSLPSTSGSESIPEIGPALTIAGRRRADDRLIGVVAAMAEAEVSRVRNGYGRNGSGPRLAQAVRECTYPDFLKLVMSADSVVTFSSVHSEVRSWSIPSEDPYEEAAQQLFEQVPHPPEYVPRDHVPVFVPEFEHSPHHT